MKYNAQLAQGIRLFDVFEYQASNFPLGIALAGQVDGTWVNYSTRQCLGIIDRLAMGLIASGLNTGDKISIVASNRPEWILIDQAASAAGLIIVPLYTNLNDVDYKYIIDHAEVRAIVVQDEKMGRVFERIAPHIQADNLIFSINATNAYANYQSLLQSDSKLQAELQIRKQNILTTEVATIIYTSGTQGTPKGVMLSHNNIINNAFACVDCLGLRHHISAVSSLPLSHVFERTVNYIYILAGMSIYYADKIELLGDVLRDVKPEFFTTVPRLMEKVYEKILAKGAEQKGIRKYLFYKALAVAEQYNDVNKGSIWYQLELYIYNRLVFSKWRAALGGKLEGVVSGAAAFQPKLARIFLAAGIPFREGYGQTESSPVICCNRFYKGGNKIGTVGPAVPCNYLKIAEDGEILVKGANVMLGYYKQPDLTKTVIDVDGWLHTGDVGKLIDGKFLKITDRKKEIFKNSAGKYVAPQPIENALAESRYIDHAMVLGENEKSVAALIVPNFEQLTIWCAEENLYFDNLVDMLLHPSVHKKYLEIRNQVNAQLNPIERVQKFKLLSETWTQENGDLTPTLKIKRRVIMERHEAEIALLFN